MSESSDEEDPIDNIDFSVISNAIEAGGNTLDQILNAVHYGSPEVRQLLRESCDYIFECKHCKSLFRSIPNFVAHKRIYCGDKSFFQNAPKKKQKKREEVVVVRPVSPSLSVAIEIPKEGDKTVLEQILTGTFEGNSEAYKHYTDVASNVEKQKLDPPSTVVVTSSIKNTQKAVNVSLVDRPSALDRDVPSNASSVIAKAKKAQKPPLTKIVDGLKKSAKTASSLPPSPKKVTEKVSPKGNEGVGLQKKLVDKSAEGNGRKTKDKAATASSVDLTMACQSVVTQSPKKVLQGKAEPSNKKSRKGDDKTGSDDKAQKTLSSDSSMKSAKVVLVQLQDKEVSSKSTEASAQTGEEMRKTAKVMEKSQLSKPVQTDDEPTKVGKPMEKQQLSKPVVSQLRPVKTQDGSELSELSQLGHCDLNLLKCLICNLQYSQKKTLLQHMHVIHSGTKKKYPCNMCKKTFDYFWGLTRHLILNHKRSKEQVENMRAELRSLAYTVKEPEQNRHNQSQENVNSSNGNEGTGRTSRRPIQKTVVPMHTCQGCEKSFWKKSNFTRHLEQCSFYARLPANVKQKNKTSIKEGVDTKEEETGPPSEQGDEEQEMDLEGKISYGSKTGSAASRRMRIQGRFVSNKDTQKFIDAKLASEAQSKNRLVKKLKEKSRAYVPPQRFINTRRSTEFYHSPAQRTRFHDQRRAVVTSPKRDSRSPSKSPKKSAEQSTSSSDGSQDNSSERQKLESARRNLAQVLQKTAKTDSESGSEKESSPVKTRSRMVSENNPQTSHVPGTDARRSRSSSRGFVTPSRDSSNESRRSLVKGDMKIPSRDSSVDSVRSRQSTRSSVSMDKPRCRTKSSEILKLHSKQKESESSKESVSRDTSTEGVRSSGNSRRSLTDSASLERKSRQTTRGVSMSRDSSTDSIRTRSSDVTELKSPPMKAPADPKTSPSSSSAKGGKKSPTNKANGKKTSKSSPGKDEIDGSKGVQKEKSKPKWSSKDYCTRSTSSPSDSKKNKSAQKSKDGSKLSPESLSPDPNTRGNTKVLDKGNANAKDNTGGNTKAKDSAEKNEKKSDSMKGVSHPKITKGKARYSTRSLKAKVQAAKKVGEIRKRYITRISETKITTNDDNKTSDKISEPSSQKKAQNVKKAPSTASPTVEKINDDNKTSDKISEPSSQKKAQNVKKAPSTASPTVEKIIVSPPVKSPTSQASTSVKSSEFKTPTVVNPSGKNEAYCQTRKGYRGSSDTTTPTANNKQTEVEKTRKLSGEQTKSVQPKSTEVIQAAVTYQHRRRMPTESEGVKVIEEIWVSKMPGQPLQSIKHKKTIIDSPKNSKAGRMYVVDSSDSDKDKLKCLDFSRINHLVDYKNNKCLQCGLDFTDISSLRRHAVRHLGWKRYKCKLCAYTGFNKSECNSHIKRRHAEKLLSSGSSLSTFIVDLNKEASNVRNKKKKSTIQKKISAESETTPKSSSTATKRTSLRLLARDEAKEVEEEEEEESIATEKSDNSPSSSPSDVMVEKKISVPESNSSNDHMDDKASRKRKRTISDEGSRTNVGANDPRQPPVSEEGLKGITENKEDESIAKCSGDNVMTMAQPGTFQDQGLENSDEEIGSISDYDNDDREAPPRNVVSPTWVKMNPNVALMMATLEEARATKFSRGKRGRGGIRRLSSPLSKHPRLSTEDGLNSSKDDEEDIGLEGKEQAGQSSDLNQIGQSSDFDQVNSNSNTLSETNMQTIKVEGTQETGETIEENSDLKKNDKKDNSENTKLGEKISEKNSQSGEKDNNDSEKCDESLEEMHREQTDKDCEVNIKTETDWEVMTGDKGENSVSDTGDKGGNSVSDASAKGGNSVSDTSAKGGNSISDTGDKGVNSDAENRNIATEEPTSQSDKDKKDEGCPT